MDALNDEPVLIVAAERLPDVLNRAWCRLIDLRHEADIRTVDVRQRFTQCAARQEIAIAEYVHCIHEQDVHVTL